MSGSDMDHERGVSEGEMDESGVGESDLLSESDVRGEREHGEGVRVSVRGVSDWEVNE